MSSNRPKYTEAKQAVAKPCAQNVPKKRLYSIKELTREIGATDWFWRSQVWDGQLPYVQVGRKMLIDSNDVESFIQRHKCTN
ncbi:MAG: DNA-binding protein [Desulfobacterales bacterium]|nr:DNA-binding protein [Desulfobacterales bacterium]